MFAMFDNRANRVIMLTGGRVRYTSVQRMPNLLVIADPVAPHIRLLRQLPPEVHIVVSDDAEKLKEYAPWAAILLNGGFHSQLFRTVFPLCTNLEWVHNLSAGVEQVLTPEVIASPVPLTNGRGVFKTSLAEFVIASILYFAKDLRRMIRNQQAGIWEPFDITEVKGQTLGVIGYGEIGRESARLANALGLRVRAMRRRVGLQRDPFIDAEYGPDGLHALLAESDYVLVATPLTPETRAMIGEREFELMRPASVIINVGRGPVIVEPALINALETHRIKGAALDVFDNEPLPTGHPFFRLDNVLLSPHCADHTPGWVELAMQVFLENMQRFLNRQPLTNVVQKEAGY